MTAFLHRIQNTAPCIIWPITMNSRRSITCISCAPWTLWQIITTSISFIFLKKSNNIIKRDTSVCFYDYTNYYFETKTEEENYVDEVTGETIKGLCKYGPSKEHRPIPLLKWDCSWIRTASLCPCASLPFQTMGRPPLSHWKKALTDVSEKEIYILRRCRPWFSQYQEL